MTTLFRRRARLFSLLLATSAAAGIGVLACGGGDDSNGDNPGGGADGQDASGTLSDTGPEPTGDGALGDAGFAFPTPIHHLVIVVKENHTFDNFFGLFDEEGETPQKTAKLSDGTTITRPACPKGGLGRDLSHTHPSAVKDYTDGFDSLTNNITNPDTKKKDYLSYCTFSDGNQGNSYWTLARNWMQCATSFRRYIKARPGALRHPCVPPSVQPYACSASANGEPVAFGDRGVLAFIRTPPGGSQEGAIFAAFIWGAQKILA